MSSSPAPASRGRRSRAAALGSVHLAVLLFGAAGLFGKLLALGPLEIVAGRVLFASVALAAVLWFRGESMRPDSRRDVVGLAGLGVLLAIHWVTFFHAIQLSTVALGLVTFSTAPVFAALLEPAVDGESWSGPALAAAVVSLAGVVLVVPEFAWSSTVTRAAFWGVVSGLTFALLSIANRGYVQRYSARAVAFHQDLWALIALVPVVLMTSGAAIPGGRDLGLLLLLGTVFTALAHTLFIRGLSVVNARSANVIATLEPVYGVVLALVLLGEEPAGRTLVGGGLIVAAAAWVTLRNDA